MRHWVSLFLLITILAPAGLSAADISAHDDAVRQDTPIFLGSVVIVEIGVEYSLIGCGAGWQSCDSVTAEELGVTELQMLVWATHGTTIHIFGKWADAPGATGCFREVEAAKATHFCGSGLPNERMDWGDLKSSYR